MIKSQTSRISFNRILEIGPDIYQLSDRGVNIILIVEDELTLIDTGYPGSSVPIAGFISSLGRSVDEIGLIIITHNHIDHMGGLAELREMGRARVAVHQAGIIGDGDEPPYPAGIRRLLRVPFFSNLRRRFLLSPGDVDIRLSDGDVLEPLGGLRVVHTPGHTPCSISLYSPRDKLLIVSDTLVRSRRDVRLPHKTVATDFTEAMHSIRKMAGLDFDILCFGHRRPFIGGASARVRDLVDGIKD
ncbi:MAG: MBL fold metallo-hydrolase [Dehalococcoidales bacterium]|nr:MAG: MBL fold metallo-hydrolase [Dehalococcoidales bacterium]